MHSNMTSEILASCFLATFCAAALADQTNDPPAMITIAIPKWAADAACTVRANGRIVARNSRENLTLVCPAADGVVQCNGGTVEPIDVALTETCRTGALRLRQASPATVEVMTPSDVTVEWLGVSESGRVVPIAIRRFKTENLLVIPVANVRDRIVRFSRPGASPANHFLGRHREITRGGRFFL